MPPELKSQLPDTKPVWQEAVEASQSDYFMEHGKYQRFQKDALEVGAEVHEYIGPSGAGYMVFEYKEIEGKKYSRTTNIGPETWHETEWHELEQK